MCDDELDRLTPSAIAIYEQNLKPILEPEQTGRTVATLLIGPNRMDQLASRIPGNRIAQGNPK